MRVFGIEIKKADTVTYTIVNRGGYEVIKRTYTNGNVKTDRVGSRRAGSTMRTATNGRYFA